MCLFYIPDIAAQMYQQRCGGTKSIGLFPKGKLLDGFTPHQEKMNPLGSPASRWVVKATLVSHCYPAGNATGMLPHFSANGPSAS